MNPLSLAGQRVLVVEDEALIAMLVADYGSEQPLGRPGQPNEVAPAHLFLACEDSSYETGQILHPNRGEVVGG